MVEEFKKSYKNGYEVMLSPEERDQLVEYIKELEHSNNIINELDNMFYETFRISQNGYYSISEWELKEFTDKIKELKGSDKE